MKSTTYQKLSIFVLSFSFVLFFVSNSFGQTTYKVVCDKTDHTVKVVESINRSPNYVPIKSGFPFRQIAQKWIDENYSTTVCNPEDIIKKIKEEEGNKTPPSSPPVMGTQTTGQGQKTSTVVQPRAASISTINQPRYINTSFNINAKFSDIGNPFSLESNLAPGFGVGLEQLFGKKYYVGIGLGMDFYFVDFSDNSDIGNFSFYWGKFPLFFGYRTYNKNNFVFMSEVGAEFNSKIQSSNDDFDFRGKTPSENSFDLTARVKFGKGRIMLTLGTEFWVTEIFENDDYRMAVFYIGLRLGF